MLRYLPSQLTEKAILHLNKEKIFNFKYFQNTFYDSSLKYWIEGARINTLLPISLFLLHPLAYYENSFQFLVFLYCLAFASWPDWKQLCQRLSRQKGSDTIDRLGPRQLVSNDYFQKIQYDWAILVLTCIYNWPKFNTLWWLRLTCWLRSVFFAY